jgi:hypothetical protein
MRRLLTLSLLLLSLAAGNAFAQQQFSSLEEKMTEAEFKAAGLDKLSAEELAALNAWLAGRVAPATAGTAPSAADDRRGFRSSPDEDQGSIVSTVPGEFRGWRERGDRFELANGQVWETVEAAKFVVNLRDPMVSITPGMLNSWYLRVDGYNARVKVTRIR